MHRKQVVIDFETRSAVPIEMGLMNYFNDPHVSALCMAYKIDDEPTRLWLPDQKMPFNPNLFTVYAFNVVFDWMAWNQLTNFKPINLKHCIDIRAICGRFTFPQNLAAASKLLNKRTFKDPKGKKLIQEVCTPPFNNDPVMLHDLYKYCVTDVEDEYELLNNLPAKRLTKLEQEIWFMTQEINLRGVPVDVDAAKVILDRCEQYIAESSIQLIDLTNGVIKAPTQSVAIKNWVNDNSDLNLPGVGKDVLDPILSDPPHNLLSAVLNVLKIRRDAGRSSIKKLKRIISESYQGRMYNILVYYKARTGRFAGRGFQLHNLPREALDADMFNDVYKMFRDRSIFFASDSSKSPIDYGKMMIRGLIKPTNPTYSLVWSDYSNIESRILFWLAKDFTALRMYEQGEDLYVHMAAFILIKSPKDITPKERFLGKQAILLCGYGGGAKKLQTTANGYNIMKVSFELAKQAVDGYRKKYKKVKNLWYKLINHAKSAVENFSIPFDYYGVNFVTIKDRNGIIWLRVMIPSGRNLYYCEPGFRKGMYGKEIFYHGLIGSKWMKISLSPQVLIENIVQALARDILCYHKLAINKTYPVLFSVHDEIACEIEDYKAKECYDHIEEIMINPPFWCGKLPLNVESKIRKRYEK